MNSGLENWVSVKLKPKTTSLTFSPPCSSTPSSSPVPPNAFPQPIKINKNKYQYQYFQQLLYF